MKLRVVQNYNSVGRHYEKGQVIEVLDHVGEWLMRDSEGSFVEIKPKPKRSLKKPPKDKALDEPDVEK